MYNNKPLESYQADILTAEKVRDFIAGGRNKVSRAIANNTRARVTNGGQDVAITLHNTDIIVFNGDGTLTLNSGGWQTVTTKERLNRYTQAGITQKAGIWYMRDGSLFYDGVTIRPDGTPLKPRQTAKYEKQVAKIKKQAKQYARDYVEALKAGKVDYPSGGDCWACLMRGPKGQEAFPGSGHIQDHIKERYFVPSLLVNAARAAGYHDIHISLMGMSGGDMMINPERVIYKYVVKQLKGAL